MDGHCFPEFHKSKDHDNNSIKEHDYCFLLYYHDYQDDIADEFGGHNLPKGLQKIKIHIFLYPKHLEEFYFRDRDEILLLDPNGHDTDFDSLVIPEDDLYLYLEE